MIKVKRIYELPSATDGYRVLVDRLWPRGISKSRGQIDLWLRTIAPSDALRKWYGHDPVKWAEFKERYFTELEECTETLSQLLAKGTDEDITLLFSSKESRLNNAYALKEYLESMR